MRVTGVVLCLILYGAAPLFAADTPKFEFLGAYAFMRETSRSETFPAGWVASAAGNVNSWIGVVTEVGGSSHTCDSCERGPFASQRYAGTDLHLRILTFLGGPRVASHAASAVTPFAQVLFGGSHLSGGVELDGALNTGFTYQPGAGVDLHLTPATGIRVEGDYRIIRTTGHNNKEARFLAGVVLSFGAL